MDMRSLLMDPDFVEKLEQVQSMEEALALFRSEGVTVTAEELRAVLTQAEGELDESQMEDVAGGMIIFPFFRKGKSGGTKVRFPWILL